MDGGGIDIWKGKDGDYIDSIIVTVDLLKRDSEIKILIGCSEEDWRRAYDVLTQEGSDYSTQSWPHAPVSGVVTDKFGVSWWLHT